MGDRNHDGQAKPPSYVATHVTLQSVQSLLVQYVYVRM